MATITQREIARAAGVSIATVSRALRNSADQRPETIAHVRTVAEALGYRPNPLLAVHMSHVRSATAPSYRETIAIISAFATSDGWKAVPSYQKYVRGCHERGEALGYRLDHFWLREPGMTGQRLTQILRQRGIRGAVLLPFPRGYGQVDLDWDHMAVATVGYAMIRPRLNSASSRHHQITATAIRELRHLGYRRIGLALGPLADRYAEGLFTARYLLHSSEVPPAQRLPPFLARTRSNWNAPAFLKWYRAHRPDAIIVLNAVVLAWLESAGIGVPGQVGLVNLDKHEGIADWSGVDEYNEQVGASAIDLIVEQINHNALGLPLHPKAVLTEGGWSEGRTTRNQRSRR